MKCDIRNDIMEVIHKYFEDNQTKKFTPPEFAWSKVLQDYIPPNRI